MHWKINSNCVLKRRGEEVRKIYLKRIQEIVGIIIITKYNHKNPNLLLSKSNNHGHN